MLTLTLDGYEIRQAITEYIRKEHPEFNGKWNTEDEFMFFERSHRGSWNIEEDGLTVEIPIEDQAE